MTRRALDAHFRICILFLRRSEHKTAKQIASRISALASAAVRKELGESKWINSE
jgi:hypothetical protein